MPLDRLITIHVEEPGSRDEDGRFVPGPVIDSTVWATRFDQTLEDIEESGGNREQATRAWRIRWRRDVADTVASRLRVSDDGLTFETVNVIEETDDGRTRRRWMLIEGIYSS